MAVMEPDENPAEVDPETIRHARQRGYAMIGYAHSLPDVWLPGELEEHRRRMEEEPGYADAPRYVRPERFREQEQDLPPYPEYPDLESV